MNHKELAWWHTQESVTKAEVSMSVGKLSGPLFEEPQCIVHGLRCSAMYACVPANNTKEKWSSAAVNQMPFHYLNGIWNQYGHQGPPRAHPEASGLLPDVLIGFLGCTSSVYSSHDFFSMWHNRQKKVGLNLPFWKLDLLLLVMCWCNWAFLCPIIHWFWRKMKCSLDE